MTLRQRVFAGWFCMGAGFAIVALLGTGMVEPPGVANARSLQALVGAYAPWLLAALVAFVAGLVLIRATRR